MSGFSRRSASSEACPNEAEDTISIIPSFLSFRTASAVRNLLSCPTADSSLRSKRQAFGGVQTPQRLPERVGTSSEEPALSEAERQRSESNGSGI